MRVDQAPEANGLTRRGQRSIPSVIPHGIDFTDLTKLRTTRALNAAVEDTRQAAPAVADP
jgi:hypothetical protein